MSDSPGWSSVAALGRIQDDSLDFDRSNFVWWVALFKVMGKPGGNRSGGAGESSSVLDTVHSRWASVRCHLQG